MANRVRQWRVDRNAASDEAQKLNLYSMTEGAILHYELFYRFIILN